MVFEVNGRTWHLVYVNPKSAKLLTSKQTYVLGCTDNKESSVYINNRVYGSLLTRVISHELCHVFCFSYGIRLDIETEEIVADFLATYGRDIFDLADDLLCLVFKIC